MKWLIAFISAVVISVLAIQGISFFNTAMAKQVIIWSESNFMLGALPKFLVELHMFLTKNIFTVVRIVTIIIFAVCFIIAARKGR